MRRLVVLGIAVAAGCAGDVGRGAGPLDGFWAAGREHTLELAGNRYETGDRDTAGMCRTTGDFLIEGGDVRLHRDSAGCAGAPDGLAVDGDRLVSGERSYLRTDPSRLPMDFELPPAQR